MAANRARSGTQKTIPVIEAKELVLRHIQDGLKVAKAMALVNRSEQTYLDWMKKDPVFNEAVRTIRSARTEEKIVGRAELPPFDEFSAKYLHQPLSVHQYRMWDVIEGRPPRDMHDSMTLEQGYDNRVLINVPPDHAKSTTFTVNYVVYLIHQNPDVRVVLVSKGLKLAQDFLYEIKLKLTSPLYREMHLKFGPEGGWKDEDGAWASDRIYVKGKNENGIQKDPTVQAMGLKGQIYGRRADLVILDDIVDTKNAREVDFQLRLINRDIDSRLPSEEEGGGLLLILGTRVAPMDIYRTLLDARDGDDRRVWTYFRQPAVLDYGNGDSASWTTLWPKRWPGSSLARKRVDAGWNLIYQQLDIDDDMTFRAEAVNASINGMRLPGPMNGHGPGHRPGGMSDLYRVGGLDPAATGNTAIIIAGLDRETSKRYVLDGWNKTNASAGDIIEKVKYFVEVYALHELVIEKNALQRFIAQLPELVDFARARGCKITPNYTTANDKFDSDWGVQSMGPLFDSCIETDPDRPGRYKTITGDRALIELPSPRQNTWINDLIQQLTIWQPEGMAQKQKTDLVMALWFTHLAFMEQINRKRRKTATHLTSPFMTPNARGRQGVINLAELRAAKRAEEMAVGS